MTHSRALLCLGAALLLGASIAPAQQSSPARLDQVLTKIPPEFPPTAMPYFLDIVVDHVSPASLETLRENLRKRPDLAATLERLDEKFIEHRLALVPSERGLESVRNPGYRSPVAQLAVSLAAKLPELVDTPADTALRAVGAELAHRALKTNASPLQIEAVLDKAPKQSAQDFLSAAERFLEPTLLGNPGWTALSVEQRADLARNTLAGALLEDAASVVRFESPPPLEKLIGLGREALEAHAKLVIEQEKVFETVQTSMQNAEKTLEKLQQELVVRRGDVEQSGRNLMNRLDPPEADKAAYRRAADDLLRAQAFVEALSSGSLQSVVAADPAAAVEKLIPPEFQSLAGDIRQIVTAPQKIAGEVDRLLATGRDAMEDLDSFVANSGLSLEVRVGPARLDAAKLTSGLFAGCFEAAVASSGLTLDIGSGGRLDVGALVGGLAGNDLLGALGGSSLTVDVAGVPVDIVGLATNLATGNLLGAIGGLFGGSGSPFGGLFGGGGGNARELRKIQEQLAQIQRTLEQIVRQLEVIERKIDQLREEFRAAHLETMARLDAISLDLTAVRVANASFFRGQAAPCQVLADALRGAHYDKVRSTVWDALFLQVERCHNYALETPSTLDVPPALRLLLNERDNAAEARKELRDRYLAPHFNLLERSLKGQRRQRAPELMLDPRPTIDSVRARFSNLGTPPPSTTGDPAADGEADDVRTDAVLDAPFEINQMVDTGPLAELVDHVFRMQSLSPYYNLREKWIVTPRCVLQGEDCVGKWAEENRTVVMTRLGNTVRLVNTALVQQALFNGDLLLPEASTILNQDPKASSAETLQKVLGGNPVFAANLTHYVLRERLEGRGFRARASQYALARLYAEKSGGDTSFLTLLFPDGKDKRPEISFFLHAPETLASLNQDARTKVEAELKARCGNRLPGTRSVHAVLPGPLCVPLPGQEDFARGILEVTPSWSRATALRERLLDEIAGYTFRNTLSPEDRKIYDELQILNRSLAASTRPRVTPPASRKGL